VGKKALLSCQLDAALKMPNLGGSMLSLFSDRQWFWLASAFYLAGFLLGIQSFRRRRRKWSPTGYSIVAVGYVLQLIGLYLRGHAVGACPLGNKFEILQFTAWSAISLYLVVGVSFRSTLLDYFTAGLAAAISIASLAVRSWDAKERVHLFGDNPWIEFHAALALFSYGVFALLALSSAMLLLRNHSLKAKRPGGWFSHLPSILDLDDLGVRLLGAGVVLLGASLAVGGIYWLRDTSSVNHLKLLVTAAVWFAYASALGLRLTGRLLTKRFAWTCLALFAVALISLGPVDASRHSPRAATTVPDNLRP
jgi:ABC-type uncharacterized transport system permease subunit